LSGNRIKKKRCSTSALRPHSYIIHRQTAFRAGGTINAIRAAQQAINNGDSLMPTDMPDAYFSTDRARLREKLVETVPMLAPLFITMYTGAVKIYGFGSDNTPVFAESFQGLLPGDLFAGFGFSLDTAGLTNEKTCAYVDDVQIAGSFNELDRIAERAASECGRATCGPKTIKLKARETGPAGAAILLGAIIENAQSRRRYLQQENEAVQHTGESDHRLQDIQAVSAAVHEGT
jgi:hypothetical protein